MKPKHVKSLLLSKIHSIAQKPEDYCNNPNSDFTRRRKLPLDKLMLSIIGMESGSLSNEIIDAFDTTSEIPTASAFIQQRNKINPAAFESIFATFSNDLMESFNDDIPILAVDGSDIQIPTNPSDTESYITGTNGHKGYNLLHLNAFYDLNHHLYPDVIIQKAKARNEHKAFQDLVDSSSLSKALVIADRGYESFNSMAHIQEKGWFFLIRVKDSTGIKQGLELPESDCFDVNISLKLTRKKTNDVKELAKDKNHYRIVSSTQPFDFLPIRNNKSEATIFYELNFRIVRFPITDGTFETVVTNLDSTEYTPDKLKELYAFRWGIETSFRDLKYTIGMLNFHSKKVMCIFQEIYAHLIMYNFAEMITSHVVIKQKQRKYTYKANFSVAAHICRLFYRGKTSSPRLETIISKNLIPIRQNRHHDRKLNDKIFHGFLYRVA